MSAMLYHNHMPDTKTELLQTDRQRMYVQKKRYRYKYILLGCHLGCVVTVVLLLLAMAGRVGIVQA